MNSIQEGVAVISIDCNETWPDLSAESFSSLKPTCAGTRHNCATSRRHRTGYAGASRDRREHMERNKYCKVSRCSLRQIWWCICNLDEQVLRKISNIASVGLMQVCASTLLPGAESSQKEQKGDTCHGQQRMVPASQSHSMKSSSLVSGMLVGSWSNLGAAQCSVAFL